MTPAVPPVPAQPAVPAPMTADAQPAPIPSALGQPAPGQPAPGQFAAPMTAQPAAPMAMPQPPDPAAMTESAPERGAHRSRRLSLRTRLIGLVVSVAVVALVAVDVFIPVTTKSALITTKDQTLAAVIAALPVLTNQVVLQTLSENNPLAGEVGWSVVAEGGTAKVVVHPPGFGEANPVIGHTPPVAAAATVSDLSSSATYRILSGAARHDEFGRQVYLVAWIPLNDVHQTIDRLVLLEIVISLGLLVLLGAIASFAVRRELRPLQSMASAADEIAAGDLTRRVVPGAPGTEVGRLGVAFNGMVDSVSGLLAERSASEDRMRQFVADASHELRTPVAAIRGYTDLYRAGALPDDPSVQRAMERMGFESRRMGALVEDLLTLIHADADAVDRTGTVDLVPLLFGVLDDAAVIDPTRSWKLDALTDSALVHGDRLRLHQIFANLLGNVRTHTPPGTATIVYVTAQQGVAQVSVMDNGPGVDFESLPRLFDRFYRVDKARSREQGGSGLGLSIVAAIARMHGGRVWAAPSPVRGLTITVQLPLAGAEPGPAAGPAEPPADAPSADAPPDSSEDDGRGPVADPATRVIPASDALLAPGSSPDAPSAEDGPGPDGAGPRPGSGQ